MENESNKFIDFIITQKCTYKCKYCSQSKKQQKCQNDATIETINSFYKLLDKIEKDYEITITGGEAILHPNFWEIIETVKMQGFKINLITNLSFKLETYERIFDLLQDSLNKYDISFHLDEIQNFSLMLEKLEKFLEFKPKNTKTTFFIPLYNVDTKKELKIDKILRLAKRHNIEYEFQPIRFLNKYKEEYSEKYDVIPQKQNNYGKLCYTGCESAVIYEDGNAYRCYGSRLLKSNYLGNIKEHDFQLNDYALTCTNCACMCPKPKKYNQICIEKDYQKAIKESIRDTIFLPETIVRHRKTLLSKLKQFFELY